MNREELSVVYGISSVLVPHMCSAEDKIILRSVLRDVFPSTARPRSSQTGQPNQKLTRAVEDHLRQNHMCASQEVVNKVSGTVCYMFSRYRIPTEWNSVLYHYGAHLTMKE